MILINCPREFFQILAENKNYVEIGVYRGEYSKGIFNFKPKKMTLIDPWDDQPESNYLPEDHFSNPAESLKKAFVESGYYKDGLIESLKYAYLEVDNIFKNNENVVLLKGASKDFYSKFEDKSVDFLYIDGNHRYDYVLADLERWAPKISDTGIIILDDIYVSSIGKMQHLSALEALSTFLKLNDFMPVAMNMDAFGNVVITRNQNFKKVLDELIHRIVLTEYTYISLPNNLIHCCHHDLICYEHKGILYSKEFLSFE
jgi:hypothetical protein